MKVYLLSRQADEESPCVHERVYKTEDAAELNLLGAHRAEYARYLAGVARDLPTQIAGDPTPRSFFDWLQAQHGWSIDELELVG